MMSENVRIPTSKKCCSGCSMSNKQPEDLWGSSVVMEFFNTNLDRKFQSSLGLAQGKTVKWGVSFPPRTPLSLPSPPLREHSLPPVHQLAPGSSERPRVKGEQTFPSIHLPWKYICPVFHSLQYYSNEPDDNGLKNVSTEGMTSSVVLGELRADRPAAGRPSTPIRWAASLHRADTCRIKNWGYH